MSKTTKYETSVQRKLAKRLGLTETSDRSVRKSANDEFEKFFGTPLPTSTEEEVQRWMKSHQTPNAHASPSDLEAVRGRLVEEAKHKPLRDLFQLDALITRQAVAGVNYGSYGTPDEDGDCLNCERKLELRNTGDDTVRIQVPVGVTRAEASRVLRKAADWIESRRDVLDPEVWEGLGGIGTIILDHRTDSANG